MDKRIGRINIRFGWCWLFAGLLEGMWLGLYAFKGDWLGGYASLTRRFLRLSHIAFMALALTNILYGLCLDSVKLSERVKRTGSYAMITAAVSMPAVCILSVFNSFFQSLFFIPALSFACGVFTMALGQIKKAD